MTPMPPGIHQAIMEGRFYLAEGVTEGAEKAPPPVRVPITDIQIDAEPDSAPVGGDDRSEGVYLR